MLTALALALATAPAHTLAPAQESGPQGPWLHPDSADLVFSIPDLPAMLGAYGRTSFARMMGDEDLHAALGEVMGSGPVDPTDLLVEQLRGMEGSIPPILDMHRGVLSASVSMDLDEEPAGGLLGYLSLGDMAGGPPVGIRTVVDFEDEVSCSEWVELVKGSMGMMGADFSSRAVTLDGDGGAFGSAMATITTVGGGPEGEVQAIAHAGTRAVITLGIEDVEAELARLAGAAPGSVSASMSALGGKVPPAEGAPVAHVYMTPYGGLAALTEGMDQGVGALEAMLLAPVSSMFEMMLGSIASGLIRGGYWEMSINGEGRYVTTGWIPGDSPLPTLDMMGGRPMDGASLNLSHPDALVTAVASFDPAALLGMLFEGGDADSIEAAMVQMEQDFGFRVDRDLIEPLGSSVSYSLPKLRSLLSAPNLMAVASLDDRETFIKGMDGLMVAMTAAGTQGQRTEYRGATMYTWSLEDLSGGGMQSGMSLGLPIDLASFARPTLTVMDDRVLISTLPQHAKREVRRVAKLIKAGEEAELHAGLSRTGVKEGATMVTFADWPVFFGNLYVQLRALAPMLGGLAGGGQDLAVPFKMDALPDMEIFTRHFSPSERYVLVTEGGRIDVTESSIGPEVSMVAGSVVMAGMFAFGGMAAVPDDGWDDEEFIVADATEPEAGMVVSSEAAATEASLMSLSVALKMYQLDHDGSAPATLDLLLKGEGGSPGYVDAVGRDGWGREFRYSADGSAYELWSIGPNGIDEKGEGDDLPVR